jgi:hypothetical protein
VNSVPELSIQQLVDSSTRRTSLGNCKMLMWPLFREGKIMQIRIRLSMSSGSNESSLKFMHLLCDYDFGKKKIYGSLPRIRLHQNVWQFMPVPWPSFGIQFYKSL